MLKNTLYNLLRWSEKYTKTDMVYLAKNSFWLNTNTIVATLLAFLLSVLFSRYISKDIYGTYQFLISIGSIIASLTLVGMNNAVTQAVARGFDGTVKTSVKEQFRFAVIPTIVGLAISFYYIIYSNYTLSISIAIIALILPISNSFNTWSAFLYGKKNFKSLFLFNQIINFFYYGGLIIAIFFTPYVLPLIITNFLLNLLGNFVAYFIIIKKYHIQEESDPEALKYGKKLSLSSIIPMIALSIDNIIVFHFFGASQLAIYIFASIVPERLGGLLRPISAVALPKFSIKNYDEIKLLIPKKIKQLFGLSLFSGILYILLAPIIYKIFFPAYSTSIIYSQVYTIAIILSTTASLSTTALLAVRSKHIFTLNIINPILNIGAMLISVYFFGFWGVIYGRILGNAIHFFLSYHLVQSNQED
jgi:O-antigen/teichoic acid export membrane protein